MSSFAVLLILGALYMLPFIVALMRGKRSLGAIFVCNLFFGWTFIGWLLTLIWALTYDTPAVVVNNIYREPPL